MQGSASKSVALLWLLVLALCFEHSLGRTVQSTSLLQVQDYSAGDCPPLGIKDAIPAAPPATALMCSQLTRVPLAQMRLLLHR